VSFVLDCSETLPWIFTDEAAEATDQLLDTLQNGAQARVPALWHLELANVLIGAQSWGRIDQAGIEAFLSHLTSYAISVDVETIPRAWTKTLDLAVHGYPPTTPLTSNLRCAETSLWQQRTGH